MGSTDDDICQTGNYKWEDLDYRELKIYQVSRLGGY